MKKSTQESKHIHLSKAIIQYEIKDKAASPTPTLNYWNGYRKVILPKISIFLDYSRAF